MALKRTKNGIVIDTAGYNRHDQLIVNLDSRCGAIQDGVGFTHVEDGRAGGWVVALDDLRAIVSLAEAQRRKHIQ